MSATLQPSRIRHQRFGAAFPGRDRRTKSKDGLNSKVWTSLDELTEEYRRGDAGR